MGRIKGWRKSFEAPDNISYQSTKDLYDPETNEIIPKGTLIGIQRIRGAPGWKSLSEPGGYTIDEIPFVSKRGGLDTIIDWMKRTEPITDKSLSPASMIITLSAYQYVGTVYLEGEDNEAEDFVQNVFVDGWKGVQKEFPTVDKLEWGFLTAGMFIDESELVKLSKFLDMPIVDETIELSAPEYDPVRAKRESKVKIVWK